MSCCYGSLCSSSAFCLPAHYQRLSSASRCSTPLRLASAYDSITTASSPSSAARPCAAAVSRNSVLFGHQRRAPLLLGFVLPATLLPSTHSIYSVHLAA